MMNFGLSENTIFKINEVFEKHLEIVQVILYGSRAKGNYKQGSDIDLTMKGNELALESLLTVSNELDDLMLPYTFDLSIYNQIENKQLIQHINRVGIMFYTRTSPLEA